MVKSIQALPSLEWTTTPHCVAIQDESGNKEGFNWQNAIGNGLKQVYRCSKAPTVAAQDQCAYLCGGQALLSAYDCGGPKCCLLRPVGRCLQVQVSHRSKFWTPFYDLFVFTREMTDRSYRNGSTTRPRRLYIQYQQHISSTLL